MKIHLFDVYSTIPIELVKGKGTLLFDKEGNKYLDFYGGHAVISIGHSHPHYVKSLIEQISHIGFYSNSIKIPQQQLLAEKLVNLSGYTDYRLFLCNSGAEAVDNALKIASFHNRKNKIISFKKAFHGRTIGALSITDNTKIVTSFNEKFYRIILDHKDQEGLECALKKGDICAVITEGIQGVAGIIDPGVDFFRFLQEYCRKYNVPLILDEIQSGYGRSGDFFAHQYAGISPDLIAVAKGMGNGFPLGGVLIAPYFKAFHGMLGTTFGGNYLSCTAALSVLEVIKNECLIENVIHRGNMLIKALREIPQIKRISGRGLMLGLHFYFPVSNLRETLLKREKVFVGTAIQPNILRVLPPLSISNSQAMCFVRKLKSALAYLEYLENE